MNPLVQSYDEEIALVLAYHNGDMLAAIESLLKDRDFLVREIEYASLAMSAGYSRGWKPSTSREAQL